MTDEEWDARLRALPRRVSRRRRARKSDRRGQRARATTISSLLFNAHHETIEFTLPDAGPGTRWHVLVDTALRATGVAPERHASRRAAHYPLSGRSLALLQRRRAP